MVRLYYSWQRNHKFLFCHHRSLETGGRKLRHDLVHSVLDRSGFLFPIRANDSLTNAAEDELVGSATDEIEDQRLFLPTRGFGRRIAVSRGKKV